MAKEKCYKKNEKAESFVTPRVILPELRRQGEEFDPCASFHRPMRIVQSTDAHRSNNSTALFW